MVKRILHYVKGMVTSGLQFYNGFISYMVAYSDADWEGFPDTHWSFTGFCVFVGNTLIS